MVFQRPNPFPTMSIFDNVAAGLRLNGSYKKSELSDVVEKSLKGANLWNEVKDRLNKPGSGLSGGQQQRLCIARAIAVEPKVLLMDEPCSALDPISTLAIEDLIGELKERFTIVIVTHNMQQAARVSDRTAFFNLAAVGQPGKLIDRDRRHGADLLQPVGPGHGGLHLGPLRLNRAVPLLKPLAVLHGGATARPKRARPWLPGAGPFVLRGRVGVRVRGFPPTHPFTVG